MKIRYVYSMIAVMFVLVACTPPAAPNIPDVSPRQVQGSGDYGFFVVEGEHVDWVGFTDSGYVTPVQGRYSYLSVEAIEFWEDENASKAERPFKVIPVYVADHLSGIYIVHDTTDFEFVINNSGD